MKKIAIATILAVGLTTSLAFAYGNGYGMRGQGRMGGGHMMGCKYGMMGPQQGNYNCPNYLGGGQRWTTAQQQEFLDSTVELRKKLHDKRFELNEAQRNPNTTADQLGTLQKELIDIRTQLNNKAVQFNSTGQ